MQAAPLLETSDSAQPASSTFPRPTRPALTLIEGGAPFRTALAECLPELRVRAVNLTRKSAAAEDLVQDTIERALRFEAHFTRGTNLRAWLYTLMFNVFVTGCRRAKRERHHSSQLAHDPCAWTTPEQAAPNSELSRGVAAALTELNPDFRDALLLVDVAEMPYRDAALELGVPVGTVMSRLHRARRALRERLSDAHVAGH